MAEQRAAGRSRRSSKDLDVDVQPRVDPQKARPTRQNKRRQRRQSKDFLWQAGDAQFETPMMKAKRVQLRRDPQVGAVLDAWWSVTDADQNGNIDRDEYILLGKALYQVIIADGDEVAAQKSAEADWEEDSGGAEFMDDESFKRAIFQLADLWTNSLEPHEYVTFLSDLLAKMRKEGLGSDLLAAAPAATMEVALAPSSEAPQAINRTARRRSREVEVAELPVHHEGSTPAADAPQLAASSQPAETTAGEQPLASAAAPSRPVWLPEAPEARTDHAMPPSAAAAPAHAPAAVVVPRGRRRSRSREDIDEMIASVTEENEAPSAMAAAPAAPAVPQGRRRSRSRSHNLDEIIAPVVEDDDALLPAGALATPAAAVPQGRRRSRSSSREPSEASANAPAGSAAATAAGNTAAAPEPAAAPVAPALAAPARAAPAPAAAPPTAAAAAAAVQLSAAVQSAAAVQVAVAVQPAAAMQPVAAVQPVATVQPVAGVNLWQDLWQGTAATSAEVSAAKPLQLRRSWSTASSSPGGAPAPAPAVSAASSTEHEPSSNHDGSNRSRRISKETQAPSWHGVGRSRHASREFFADGVWNPEGGTSHQFVEFSKLPDTPVVYDGAAESHITFYGELPLKSAANDGRDAGHDAKATGGANWAEGLGYDDLGALSLNECLPRADSRIMPALHCRLPQWRTAGAFKVKPKVEDKYGDDWFYPAPPTATE